MLGNVRPFLPALSEENKERYNAFYCGLCKTLGKTYGMISRFMLNYDMVFVAMLYDDMNRQPFIAEKEGCFANPIKKKTVKASTGGTEYAADVLILLAYYKLLDNIYDENFFKKAGCIAVYPYFMLKVRKAQKKHPQLAQTLKEQIENQQQAEKTAGDLDTPVRPTALMTKAILTECAQNEKDRFNCGQLGFFMGRVIYLLDALKDRKEDEKEGKFNIFNLKGLSDEQAKEECFMALGEMAWWYKQIELWENKEIIDNIIYMALARSIKFANTETER